MLKTIVVVAALFVTTGLVVPTASLAAAPTVAIPAAR